MSTTLLSSNRKNSKIFSLKEKEFIYGTPLWKFMSYEDKSAQKEIININPKSDSKGLLIDSFCEKPAYVPLKNKKEDLEGYNYAKNYSLYFPLSDKLEGYNLYDVFYTEYIPARGIFLEGDENQYYEIRNGAYRKKKNIEVGDSLKNFFLKTEGMPLEKNSKLSSNIYKNISFSNTSYGEKINFFFDGIATGTSDTNCNLLYGKTIQCETKNPNGNVEITESRSVYRTKSFDIASDPAYNVFIYYEDIEIPNDEVDGYTFSFIARLDDYLSITNSDIEDVNSRKQFSVETKATILVFVKESDVYNDGTSLYKDIVLSTDWSQYNYFLDNNLIKGKTIKVAIAIGTFSSKVKTSAFMLNKGNYIVNFDDRFHIKHDEPVLSQRKYPVLINFLSSNENDSIRMPKTSSWTISYKRFINASSDSINLSKIDYLGNGLTFGYPFEGYNASDFVGHLENVFIIYDSSDSTLRYIVYSDNSKIEKTFTSLSSTDFDSVVPDDVNVHFNIILGGYVEGNTIKINNFTKYSDFMAFPYVLEEDEINKMSNTLMSVSFGSKTYEERYVSLKAEDYSNTKIYDKYDNMVEAEPIGREDTIYVITNENNAKYIWNGNTYVEGKQIFNLRENLTVLRSANFFETKNI